MDMKPLRTRKKEGHNMHHIFTKGDVNRALIKALGQPVTEMEKCLIIDLTERLHSSIPKVRMPEDRHEELHKKDKLTEIKQRWTKWIRKVD